MATYGLADCLKGGPGLDGYSYNADVYCTDCGAYLVGDVFDKLGRQVSESEFSDGDVVPQPIFFGDADTAQHCADCGEYLYGPQDEDEETDNG